MLPMHDPDRLRRLERELRDSAEAARRIREATTNGGPGLEADPGEPMAAVAELKVLDEACVLCELEREQSTA
jgi:hypothetical protein